MIKIPTGHVDYIKIGENFGFVYLKEGDWLVLWWTGMYTEEASAFDSIKYSMWISLLKEAIVNNYEVELLTEDDDSSLVVTITLRAP